MYGAREAAEHVNFLAMVAKNQFECYNSGEETPRFEWIMCWQFRGRLRSRGILKIKGIFNLFDSCANGFLDYTRTDIQEWMRGTWTCLLELFLTQRIFKK